MGSSKLYELERFAVSMYSSRSIDSLTNFKKFFFLTIFINQVIRIMFQDFHVLRLFYKLKIFKSSTFFYKGIVFFRKNKYKTNYLLGNFWFFKYSKFLIISIFFFFYPKIHYKDKFQFKKINTTKLAKLKFKKNYKCYFDIKQNNFFREILKLNLDQNINTTIFFKLKNHFKTITDSILIRIEAFKTWHVRKLYSSQLLAFFNELDCIVPVFKSTKQRQLVNVVYLDLINSYKGWRHLRGLPVKNQRTWSNGWNSYRTNLTLRSFKLNTFKQLYSNLPNNNINTVYLAEQVNLMWKLQWESEWNEAKRKRLIYLNKSKVALKIDLNLMANLGVNLYSKTKTTKKKKLILKKNVFTLGFEPGFTKTLLKTSASLNSKNTKYQLNVESTKKKEKKEKKKITPVKPKVKKKLNSWD